MREESPEQSGSSRIFRGSAVGADSGAGPVLEARGVVKRFGQVRALNGIDFALHPSEVLALVGQNGAGKSTLIKIIGGFVTPDEGSILVDGEVLGSVRSAQQAGIATVAQELSIVPTATVAENVFLGSRRGGLWRQSSIVRDALPYLRQLGLDHVDPRQQASRLTVADAQLVEIARVLARDARVVIFDEPTASLSDAEITRVKSVVRNLAAEGRSVIYVTHRLGEVMSFCDTAIVLRNGSAVARVSTESVSLPDIVTHMLGRPLESLFPGSGTGTGDAVLQSRALQRRGLLSPVNLELRAGEITGFAGQLGSGTTPLLRLLAGFEKPTSGELILEGEQVKFSSPATAVRAGVLFCTDDRKRDGFFPTRSVTQNLSSLSLSELSRGPWISARRERAFATQAAEFLGIDRARMRTSVISLSGGNQQKVVLGKLACRRPAPKVLLMNEPTRGVDVGARADIYRLIRKLADDGMAVAFASSDISEVMGLADKVVTFFRGHQVATYAGDLDERQVVLDVTHPTRSPND